MTAGETPRAVAERAVGELYHGCYRRLVAQLYAFTTDLTEAQDVVQEAFARALARPNGLVDVDNPEAWLRTVAVNVVRRRWRRRRLFDTLMLRERPVARFTVAAPEPAHADLSAALAEIPLTYRECIVLHYFADQSVDEIAATLGLPTGTVKSRLSRGRAALAERLAGYGPQQPSAADPRRSAGGPQPSHGRSNQPLSGSPEVTRA